MARRGNTVDGVLLLDKPAGLSSNAALQRARRIYIAAKAGHGGTLDPMATGLLLIAFGEATKFLQWMLDADKRYRAEVLLGVETDSGDREGQVTATHAVSVSSDKLNEVLRRFTGPIAQVPPMHSALKRDGVPLYALARRGIVVDREPRTVVIRELSLLARDGDRFTLDVQCSKGTYLRSLAIDIGRELGCGAHLVALRRLEMGAAALDAAVTLETLESADQVRRLSCLKPADWLVQMLPAMELDDGLAARLLAGQRIAAPLAAVGASYRVYRARDFLGIAEATADGWIAPRRLIAGSTLQCSPQDSTA